MNEATKKALAKASKKRRRQRNRQDSLNFLGGKTAAQKFEDMEGSKGGFDRSEFKQLKKLDGRLNEDQQKRLDYLKSVNREKIGRWAKLTGLGASAAQVSSALKGKGKSGMAGADDTAEFRDPTKDSDIAYAKHGARLPYKIKKRKR